MHIRAGGRSLVKGRKSCHRVRCVVVLFLPSQSAKYRSESFESRACVRRRIVFLRLLSVLAFLGGDERHSDQAGEAGGGGDCIALATTGTTQEAGRGRSRIGGNSNYKDRDYDVLLIHLQ